MWITIINYFDHSHVSLEFLCMHTCMSMKSLLVLRNEVGKGPDDGGCTYYKLEIQKESENKDMSSVILHQ